MKSLYLNKGYSEEVTSTILDSKRGSTQDQYLPHINRFELFCNSKGTNIKHASVADGLEYLQSLKNKNLGYSAIGTARSALSLCIKETLEPLGQLKDVAIL